MVDLNWLNKQVKKYSSVRGLYQEYARILQQVLECAVHEVSPHALVQVRVKTIAKFAEKVLRKLKYDDPVNQLTDLCGARVITHTKAEVEAVCDFVRAHFEIDEANSLNPSSLLRANEFGYHSAHFVVSFAPHRAKVQLAGLRIPDRLLGLKAEVQVRTLAQHCWADIGHDRLYKSSVHVSDKQRRESARLAALLEEVDETIERLSQDRAGFETSNYSFMPKEAAEEELRILTTKFSFDRNDAALALQIARLQIYLGDWRAVQEFLADIEPKSVPLLVCLGMAACQLHRDRPNEAEFQIGLTNLTRAVEVNPSSIDAITALADVLPVGEERKVLGLYERAFDLEPANPRILAGYIKSRMVCEQSLDFLPMLRPALDAAVRRCSELVQLGSDLPSALYHMGELQLFLDRPYEALSAYAQAVRRSASEFVIDSALTWVEQLCRSVRVNLLGPEWVRCLLLLAKQARYAHRDLTGCLMSTRESRPIREPVVIVAGGCEPSGEERMQQYRALMLAGFRGFSGTIISGGTRAGISGLVGDLMEAYPGQLNTLGYLPSHIPSSTEPDTRYTDRRRTSGMGFSPLEPLQIWIDLFSAGIDAARVKLLGINGGKIAGFEYRLANALGAQVALVRGSGRDADELIQAGEPGYVALPNDPQTVRTFVLQGTPRPLTADKRERIGQAIHLRYQDAQKERIRPHDFAAADWPELPEHLKESNRQQADHVWEKLRAVGLDAYPVTGPSIKQFRLQPEQVEIMAEMEHGRWNVERLLDGWTLGPRDPVKKSSPYLVPWAELPDSVKEWDRQAVRAIPEFLKQIGLEIRHPSRPGIPGYIK